MIDQSRLVHPSNQRGNGLGAQFLELGERFLAFRAAELPDVLLDEPVDDVVQLVLFLVRQGRQARRDRAGLTLRFGARRIVTRERDANGERQKSRHDRFSRRRTRGASPRMKCIRRKRASQPLLAISRSYPSPGRETASKYVKAIPFLEELPRCWAVPARIGCARPVLPLRPAIVR